MEHTNLPQNTVTVQYSWSRGLLDTRSKQEINKTMKCFAERIELVTDSLPAITREEYRGGICERPEFEIFKSQLSKVLQRTRARPRRGQSAMATCNLHTGGWVSSIRRQLAPCRAKVSLIFISTPVPFGDGQASCCQ